MRRRPAASRRVEFHWRPLHVALENGDLRVRAIYERLTLHGLRMDESHVSKLLHHMPKRVSVDFLKAMYAAYGGPLDDLFDPKFCKAKPTAAPKDTAPPVAAPPAETSHDSVEDPFASAPRLAALPAKKPRGHG